MNTGNVARRFLEITENVSGITGLDVNVLNSLSIGLAATSCGPETNHERFDKYAKETAERFLLICDWSSAFYSHGLRYNNITSGQVDNKIGSRLTAETGGRLYGHQPARKPSRIPEIRRPIICLSFRFISLAMQKQYTEYSYL